MNTSSQKLDPISRSSSLSPLSITTPRLAPVWQWRMYIIALILSDAFMVYLAFQLAFFVRFTINLPVFQLNVTPSPQYYASLSLLILPVWILVLSFFGLYNRLNLLGGIQEYSLIFRAATISMFLLIIAGFLEPTFIIARAWVILAWLFSALFTITGRFLLRHFVYLLRNHGYFTSPTLIVGANAEGLSIANQLTNWKTSGLKILGFVDKKFPSGTNLPGNFQVLGHVGELDQLIPRYGVEELILASSAISSRDRMLEIFQRYGLNNHVNVRFSSGLYEVITTGLTVREFASVPLVIVNKVRMTGLEYFSKICLDLLLLIPALIVLAPLLFLIAIAIKIDSPGPIIHRRRVMGVNGSHFNAYKFRTMSVNGDAIIAENPELQISLAKYGKLVNDPRVTRIGRLLRRFSLDELPQLFNVLKLQMSLVGPRMISPEEMRHYEQWGVNLLTVRPGITGIWQVSGRSDISYPERVRLDMHYIRNWSIWLDLHLLWRTIPAVLRGHGAY
jgi:exopolysaccharide biosynthesis polyprenyl glycosylphosphotransferase